MRIRENMRRIEIMWAENVRKRKKESEKGNEEGIEREYEKRQRM